MKSFNLKFLFLLVLALSFGFLIAWMDSRPGFDDTGVTAAAVLGSAMILAVVMPRRAWVWALAVGGSIPVMNILIHNSYDSIVALAFAFAGAYGGVLIRKALGYIGMAAEYK